MAPCIHSLLERGDADEKYAAMGAVLALSASEKHVTEVLTTKVGGRVPRWWGWPGLLGVWEGQATCIACKFGT